MVTWGRLSLEENKARNLSKFVLTTFAQFCSRLLVRQSACNLFQNCRFSESLETRLSSREKRDETGNLLLSSKNTCIQSKKLFLFHLRIGQVTFRFWFSESKIHSIKKIIKTNKIILLKKCRNCILISFAPQLVFYFNSHSNFCRSLHFLIQHFIHTSGNTHLLYVQ